MIKISQVKIQVKNSGEKFWMKIFCNSPSQSLEKTKTAQN